MRRAFGGQVKHIGNRHALLQKMGTARQVLMIAAQQRPEGLRPFPVQTIAGKGHPWRPVQPRLMGESHDHKPVDAGRKSPVSLVLQRPWLFRPIRLTDVNASAATTGLPMM